MSPRLEWDRAEAEALRPMLGKPDPKPFEEVLAERRERALVALDRWFAAARLGDRERIAPAFHQALDAIRTLESTLLLHYGDLKRRRAYRRLGQIRLLEIHNAAPVRAAGGER